jgi:hypothetical protein
MPANRMYQGEALDMIVGDMATDLLPPPNFTLPMRRTSTQILADIAKTVRDAQETMIEQDRIMRQVVGSLLRQRGRS